MPLQQDAHSSQRPFLTAVWRDLVMITWAVDHAVLRPLLPPDMELDLFEGEALASVVAFDFADVRVLGMAVPWHTRFPEVNLRFYLRRQLADGSWRRGVAFVQEMVPRHAVTFAARLLYDEPYVTRPMRRVAVPETVMGEAQPGERRSLVYEWKRQGEWERVIALTDAPPRATRTESIEAFVMSQEWGYRRRKDGSTREYRVAHPPWRFSPTAECLLEADIEELYGRRFANAFDAPPISTLVAEGSPVEVYPPEVVSNRRRPAG